MTPLQLTAFRAHAGTPRYLVRLDAARRRISAAPANSYVSFSAGKDSAVVADLAHRMRPGIDILMADPGCPTHWLKGERDEWLAFAAARGWGLRLFAWDKWSAVSAAESIEDHQNKAHADMFRELHAYARANGLTGRLTGMRAEESRRRRLLTAHRGATYEMADGTTAINPIADWMVADVWAYIITHGLPWLSIYDAFGPAARNGMIGQSGIDHGRLGYLKIHYPEVWREAMSRLPAEATQFT